MYVSTVSIDSSPAYATSLTKLGYFIKNMHLFMVNCLCSIVAPNLVEDWKKNLSSEHSWNEIFQCCFERPFLSDPEHNKKCALLLRYL